MILMKNHLNLIKAYELLPSSIKEKYDLLLVGQDCENAKTVHDYTNHSKYKGNIKFLGFVKNEDMPELFSNAELFVFPSLYEGFGIPLIEAMAMNIPTICAKNSSLFEIGKKASLFFNEQSPSSIKNTILNVLTDEALQTEMKKNGLKQAKQFNWRHHANNIIKQYEEHKFLHYSKTFC